MVSTYLKVTLSCMNFHIVMCRRRFVIQEVIISILLHGGRRRSPVGAAASTGSMGAGGRTAWARGLAIPWHDLTVNKHDLTASLYVPVVHGGGRTGMIIGLAVYFLYSGGLIARRRGRTAGS
jgi:hypothetical protein